ncbi:MAG: undecaprenyldiphospho-muramoylpentapeptide beta-N-acetylglucosaminyltransferase [Clostridia bacterium]|nr:undecaprenyldiphospho-muramoylpentapeptide beta-N-acetylglucosaminyltransferase [Clostridia bacterium]
MRVIMAGGGTGGHIYPAIAIAEEIKKRDSSAEIIFAGTNHGIETKIVPDNGYELRLITVSGLNRKKPWKNIKTVKDLAKGLHEAKSLIKEFKPDIVIGTGGYVCGPVVKTAARMGVRTYIHEQNAYPGLTNKLLSKSVDRVFLAFEEAAKYFKVKKAPLVTGNPVRRGFREMSREEARKVLGIPQDCFMALSFGGSLGARTINEEMKIAVRQLADRQDCRIFFATGRSHYQAVTAEADPANARVSYLEYIDDMPKYLAACDLAITRSGALTVSEIAACGRASIMIPSPNVTSNHQYFNAKVLADAGASILIEEKNLHEGDVASIIETLLDDRERVRRMERAAAAKGNTDAAGIICNGMGI